MTDRPRAAHPDTPGSVAGRPRPAPAAAGAAHAAHPHSSAPAERLTADTARGDEPPEPAHSAPGARRSPWPGTALAGTVAVGSWALSRVVPGASALLVAIAIGVVAGNALRLPAAVQPGLAVASKTLLRLGIVVLGLQLSLREIVALGPGILAVAATVVVSGFTAAELAGRRFGLTPAQRLLIGAGMSICGAAAVAAVDSAIDDQDERDTVTAVALVVAFGTLMIAIVPALVGAFGLDPVTGGLWAGASVHEVAQVVAIGGILGATALKGAVVVKLARVLLLAPVIAVIGIRRRRAAPTTTRAATRPPLVPMFVVGFLVASVVRTTGVVPQPVLETAGIVQTFLLAAAMFALGTGVKVSTLREVGPAPVLVGALTTVTVSIVGLTGVLLVG